MLEWKKELAVGVLQHRVHRDAVAAGAWQYSCQMAVQLSELAGVAGAWQYSCPMAVQVSDLAGAAGAWQYCCQRLTYSSCGFCSTADGWQYSGLIYSLC